MKNVTDFYTYVIAVISCLIIIFLVFICSPNAHALDDFDLYRYGDEQKIKIQRKEFIVKFVVYDTEEELNEVFYANRERPVGHGVRAFTLSSKDQDVCYVHLKLAKKWDDREAMSILGHEMYHCALASHRVATYDDLEEEIINIEEDKSVHGNYIKRRTNRYKNNLRRLLMPLNTQQSDKENEKKEYDIAMQELREECKYFDPKKFTNPPVGCNELRKLKDE